jgi:methyltransferase (TIGR00027 family)
VSDRYEQWDIVSSVGFTALMVAAGRAVETNRDGGLVDDPWAERFVDAAGTPQRLPTRPEEGWPRTGQDPAVAAEVDAFWSVMTTYQGVRSRYFDAALTAATERGIDQVVLLAAGLDSRAVRLSWAAGTTVYEVDQPAVLEFKDEVLAEHGAQPRCDRRVVGVDLRDDWVSALRAAGFDPQRPSVWLAEGLLPFLPAAAEADLFAAVDELSAPGSTVAVEHFAPVFENSAAHPAIVAFGAPFGMDLRDLAQTEPRTGPAERLTGMGWSVEAIPSPDAAAGFGRPLPALGSGIRMNSVLLTATRPDQ